MIITTIMMAKKVKAPLLFVISERILGFSGAQLSSSNQYNQDGHAKPQVYFVDNIDDDEKIRGELSRPSD